jgi:hypothetical protein
MLGQVGGRVGLGVVAKIKIPARMGNLTPVFQLLVSNSTDQAMLGNDKTNMMEECGMD